MSYSAVKITDRVYWVGAIDWSLFDFHGYRTQRGTTYNAYLIMADKITLVDTVKAPFRDEFLARVESIVELEKIDYIVSHHAEMDHSGCLPAVIEKVKPEKVFTSVNGAKALEDHFGIGNALTAVKDGETIDLGNARLTFIETRMLHWPDSMMSYLAEDHLVFSQDGFGMHLASGERFADEIPDNILEFEAAKYFANILLPYSPLVKKLAARIAEAGLTIDIIAPDHGPIWRKNPERIIERYIGWAEQKPRAKAIVVYDTMWGSTEKMGRVIAEGISAAGVQAKVFGLMSSHRSDVVTELLGAGALAVGSPTMNNQVYPTVVEAMVYIKGLKPQNLIGAAFGSYGWSGEAVRHLEAELDEMKIERAAPGVNAKYVPKEEDLTKCRELGEKLAEALLQRCGKDR